MLTRKLIISFHDVRHEIFFVCKIIFCPHIAQNFTVHDNLTSRVAVRFEQNRVHEHARLYPGSFRLHHLSAPHFKSFVRDKRIKGHVLRFERRDRKSVLLENSAQSRYQKRFSCAGHCALHHDW